MLKKENIFIGEVFECTNLYRYKRDGEKSIIPIFQLGSMIENEILDNVKKIDGYALLIKLGEQYLYISRTGEKILLNFYPTEENMFYVKESSLKLYYGIEEHQEKISQRKLVKEYISDSRIPIGINN